MLDLNDLSPTQQKKLTELPAIPDKYYFTIAEVSKLCQVKAHVLRYWENVFPQLRHIKRRGNRRCYQRKDVLLLRKIRHLLYDLGYKIEGAKSELNRDRTKVSLSQPAKQMMTEVIAALENVLTAYE